MTIMTMNKKNPPEILFTTMYKENDPDTAIFVSEMNKLNLCMLYLVYPPVSNQLYVMA